MTTEHLDPSMNRRHFVQSTAGAAGLIIASQVPGGSIAWAAGDFKPNVYLEIPSKGPIRLICHRSEMGQGVRTSMPMLIAEELDVALEDIVVVQATGDAKYGDQNTDGSTSARKNWLPLREAGAAAREMLITAAAKRWGVPVSECRTAPGKVWRRNTKQSFTYQQLAADASKLPLPQKPKLKARKDFRYLGKPIKGLDIKQIIQGQATFGMDVEQPNMLHAAIWRTPTMQGSIKSFDASAAKKIKGVVDVVQIAANRQPVNHNAGVAVLATNTWAAKEAVAALKVDWDPGKVSETTLAEQKDLEQFAKQSGTVHRQEGDAAKALKAANKDQRFAATYTTPYLAHAPMEPLVCTAKVDGKRCEVWAPTQDPQRARKAVAAFLDTTEDNVTINITFLGGGFGRKSQPDFVLEAVAVAKQTKGRPVKVVWSREDEIKHGFYHARSMQQMEAAVDSKGRPTAWTHKSTFPTILRVFDPKAKGPANWELGMGCTDMPFDIKNVTCTGAHAPADIRVGWLRSVCHIWHAFAVNSFIDELAAAAKEDPVAYRLALLGKDRTVAPTDVQKNSPYQLETGRLKRVIKHAADKGGWGRSVAKGRGLGFSAHYSFFSYVAMVIEAEAVAGGVPRVHQVDVALDCGNVVNKDSVIAQIEGGVAYGLSAALQAQIMVKEGRIVQSNFHDYPVIRHEQMPKVNVHLIDNDVPPTGVGEPGTPPVAPALAGALYAATGKRYRNLPLA